MACLGAFKGDETGFEQLGVLMPARRMDTSNDGVLQDEEFMQAILFLMCPGCRRFLGAIFPDMFVLPAEMIR